MRERHACEKRAVAQVGDGDQLRVELVVRPVDADEGVVAGHAQRSVRRIRRADRGLVARGIGSDAKRTPCARIETITAVIDLENDIDVALERVLPAGQRVTARHFSVQLQRVAEDPGGADALLRAVAVAPEVERDVRAADEPVDTRRDGAVIEGVERDVRAADEDVGATMSRPRFAERRSEGSVGFFFGLTNAVGFQA